MLIEDAVSSGTPQFVIDSYATLAERAKTQSFGLIEEDVIVLDTETTGLSVQDNRADRDLGGPSFGPRGHRPASIPSCIPNS